MQGFGLAFKTNATKEHFDDLIGIHPTNAEVRLILRHESVQHFFTYHEL